MSIVLKDYQVAAINQLRKGKILCGGVGSGKSLTSLGYYYLINGGKLVPQEYIDRQDGKTHVGAAMPTLLDNPMDLVIITTAKKRDSHDWDRELSAIHMNPMPGGNYYNNHVVVDSWNNIGKYVGCKDCMFILDEQRIVGTGSWVKSFYKIAGRNHWILLTATPGDCWLDYRPVFIANGFYRNSTEFIREHVVYDYHVSFPRIDRYLGEMKLARLRDSLLVMMDYQKHTVSHHETVMVGYDRERYKDICKNRVNPYEVLKVKGKTFPKPIENASEFCAILRRIVNSDQSRIDAYTNLTKQLDRVVVFYNFDFELDILRKVDYGKPVLEWNGHKHETLPVDKNSKWVYLVQYNAGNEAWECITTPYMIFYSENYSYRIMEQSSGRIDRTNTPYTDLYYWHFRSTSNIDLAINRALTTKKKFNQSAFYKKHTN